MFKSDDILLAIYFKNEGVYNRGNAYLKLQSIRGTLVKYKAWGDKHYY